MKTEHTKHQHYVPQLYLKNFTQNRNKAVVWDRVSKGYYYKKIREICYINDLYETKWVDSNPNLGKFVLDNQIERQLAELEGNAAKVIDKIIRLANEHNFVSISATEKRILIEFITTLYLRNPYILKDIEKYYEGCENEEAVSSLIGSLNYFFTNLGIGNPKPLINHSIMSGIVNNGIEGSPFNFEFEKISNMRMLFWYTKREKFITASFPFHINTIDGKTTDRIILPLGSQVACALFDKRIPFLNEDAVIEVQPQFVLAINRLYLEQYPPDLARFLIAEDEENIKKIL